jgi:hypothetical protein
MERDSGDETERDSGDETERDRGGETPRRIAVDTMMQGGRRTCVHPCGGSVVTSWQAGSLMKMDGSRRRVGPAAEEPAHVDFFSIE